MQIIATLLALPLAALGLRAIATPGNMADAVGLTAPGVPGRSEIRSVLGGLLLGSAALIIAGVLTDEATWFLAAATLMGVAIVGRLVSLAVDGYDRAVIPPLVIEIAIAAAVLAAAGSTN